MNQQFIDLSNATRELIGLLEEADERFWCLALRRAVARVDAHELAGATNILGCFGGMDTLSDLMIGTAYEVSEPIRYRNLNNRLDHLRTRTFEAARAIAARQTW